MYMYIQLAHNNLEVAEKVYIGANLVVAFFIYRIDS